MSFMRSQWVPLVSRIFTSCLGEFWRYFVDAPSKWPWNHPGILLELTWNSIVNYLKPSIEYRNDSNWAPAWRLTERAKKGLRKGGHGGFREISKWF